MDARRGGLVSRALFVGFAVVAVGAWFLFERLVSRDRVALTRDVRAAAFATYSGSLVGVVVLGWPLYIWPLGVAGSLLVIIGLSLGHPARLVPTDQLQGALDPPSEHAAWYAKLTRQPTLRERMIVFFVALAVIAGVFVIVGLIIGF